MSTPGDNLLQKTQKGLSILAFETTKQSRILRKRMRVAALQKEIKADLRDLGNLVYNALINEQQGILEEEEVKILVGNVKENKAEVDHLRDAIARLGRTKKHFAEAADLEDEDVPAPKADEPNAFGGEPAWTAEPEVTTEPVLPPKKKAKKAEPQEAAAWPAPGADPVRPDEPPVVPPGFSPS